MKGYLFLYKRGEVVLSWRYYKYKEMGNNQGQMDFGNNNNNENSNPVKIKPAANNGFSSWRRRPYEPGQKAPFALSRSKVDMFLKCPRCFYLDQRLGIKHPSMPAFTLNTAVDYLLKKEFDARRANGQAHPLMTAYGIDAIPAQHNELEIWRENFKGIRVLHPATNFELFGAIDDLWINPQGEYHIVDYKATSTVKEITLDDQWKQWYKIQAEFYQWLLRARGFSVNDVAYFVFANAVKDRKAFDGKLEFAVTVIEYKGSDKWVEKTLAEMKNCLESANVPALGANCEHCQYIEKAKTIQ